MTIVSRSAPALLALLAGGACTSQTINLVSPPAGDGSRPPDAAIDGAAVPDAAAPRDAAASPDAPGTPDAAGGCPELADQRLGECSSPPVTQCDASGAVTSTGFASVQVFTPAIDGAITGLRLWMRAADPVHDKVLAAIADLRGDPRALLDPSYAIDDHVLATTLGSISNQFGWQSVAFASPATVVANRPYGIYLRMVSATPGGTADGDWGMYNDFGHPTLDHYPRGGAFGVGSSGEWLAQPVFRDFMFEVHIVPSSCH
jgi:hypothetical protein